MKMQLPTLAIIDKENFYNQVMNAKVGTIFLLDYNDKTGKVTFFQIMEQPQEE